MSFQHEGPGHLAQGGSIQILINKHPYQASKLGMKLSYIRKYLEDSCEEIFSNVDVELFMTDRDLLSNSVHATSFMASSLCSQYVLKFNELLYDSNTNVVSMKWELDPGLHTKLKGYFERKNVDIYPGSRAMRVCRLRESLSADRERFLKTQVFRQFTVPFSLTMIECVNDMDEKFIFRDVGGVISLIPAHLTNDLNSRVQEILANDDRNRMFQGAFAHRHDIAVDDGEVPIALPPAAMPDAQPKDEAESNDDDGN